MMYAIKTEIANTRARTFTFAAQKTMYGGKNIAAGDTVYLFASENEGGAGLVAMGVVTAAKAASPLIRTIAIAAGGAPLDTAKIVSMPLRLFARRGFEHLAPEIHPGITHRRPALHDILQHLGRDHAIHRVQQALDIFLMHRGKIRQAHDAAGFFGSAFDFDIDLHGRHLRLSGRRPRCISLAMYARDTALIATLIGAVRISNASVLIQYS